jgi:hypothetical protein
MSPPKKNRQRRTPSVKSPATPPPAAAATPNDASLGFVRDKVEALKYGSLQLIVQEGRINQIEITEKVRVQPAAPPPPPKSA